MRKRTFEKLLREAVIADAETQGRQLFPELEAIPEEAQARFHAALNGSAKEKKDDAKPLSESRTTVEESAPQSERRLGRWLGYGLGIAAAILAVVLFFGLGLPRGTKPKPVVEAPLTERPLSTDAPQPASEPEPEPGEPEPADLVEIKTVVYQWQGYDCLIPEGFDPSYEWDTELCTRSLTDATQDLKTLIYHWEWKYFVIGWDDNVFSSEHINVLFDSLGWAEYPKNGLTGHSVRTVAKGVNCYHLYDTQYHVYYGFAQVASNGEGVLLMQGWSKTEAGLDTFDSVVNAFVANLNGLDLLIPPNANWSGSIKLIRNGEVLNTYTGAYRMEGSDAIIPLETFLCALGGYSVESPYESIVNTRHKASCYQLCGKRYLLDLWQHVFLSEYDFTTLVNGQSSPVRGLSETKIKSINLLPNVARGDVTPDWEQAEVWVDHRTLEAALRASGLDIAIVCDADKQEIRVTLNGPETGVWETDDVPFLYLELLDDGTARILERFGDADIRAHYAWNMTSRNIVLLTFSDQTVVRTAELNTDTDAMTLTLADGNTVEATRVSYRLIVNGQEVPVDSVFRESAKGEVHGMIPITALFRGIGCETEVNGDTVEIRRDGSLWLVLDLNAHTLINPDKPWYNYFTLAPGDTGSDFKRQRSGDELWVCTAYVENAFQILGIPERAYYDESSNEMRVTIGNTDGP